jgi:Immunoglobulin domain
MNWSGGLIDGTLIIPAASRVNVLPSGNGSISGVLQNSGTVIVSNNASILLLGGTPIVNSGLIEVQNEQALKPSGTTKVNFINSGTFRKTTSAKLMKLEYVQLQNSGTLDVQAGELSLALNAHSFSDGTRTTGSGTVRVAGATLNVAGTLTLGPALALDSGYLAGSATLNGPFQFSGGEVQDRLAVNGQFSWAGGLLKGGIGVQGAATWTGGEIDGWLSIATNSTLAIGGTATKTIKGGTLTNSGFITVTSPVTIQGDGGAVIQNFGELNFPASVTVATPWGGKPTLNNYGVLSLTNGFGVFTFPGKLLQFSSGRLELEIAGRNAGENFSQICGVPELTLDGALVVRTSGGFEPVLGDRLEFIRCAQRAGTFATYFANTPRLSPDYTLTNATLFAAAPSLTLQPVSQTVASGAAVSFSADAYGSQPMNWQWFWNGAPLAGATNSALTFSNVQTSKEGTYAALVTNIWGSGTTTQAVLKVVVPPAIVRQPVADTVNQGETAAFSVETTGNYLIYRWRFGDSWLAGATNATLVLSNVTAANAGKYKVEVSNLEGIVTSTEAILTVIVPPTITEQPVSQNVGAGSNPSLSVKVSGTEPFSYLWLKSGIPLNGATNSSLTLNNVSASHAGSYVVLVANPAGTATSQPATIAIKTPPVILAQPLSQSANVGSNVLLSVTATGVPAPTYQWRKNGVTLSGATSATLLLAGVQPRDSGDYSVVVANSQGSVESAPARVAVIVPELLFTDAFSTRGLLYTGAGYGHGTNFGATKEIGEPAHAGKGSATRTVWISWWAPGNGIATFSTAGSDFDTVLAVYRGTAVNALAKVAADDDAAGFHCSRVSFNAMAGTYYQIAVAGDGGAAGNIILSWDLLITTELLPQITQAPLDITGNTNDTVTLQVVFDAFEPTAIQWFFQGQVLAGATNTTYVIPSLQDDKVGGYAVRLTGASGRNVVSPPGDIQINTEGATGVSARNKFFDAAERALTP